jgi:hypothetical protein
MIKQKSWENHNELLKIKGVRFFGFFCKKVVKVKGKYLKLFNNSYKLNLTLLKRY